MLEKLFFKYFLGEFDFSYGHSLPCSSSVTSLCFDDRYILCGLESGLIEIFDLDGKCHRFRVQKMCFDTF